MFSGVLISILSSNPAYLDPGSGSILVQLIIAALVGAGIAITSSWSKIKGWFGIKSKPEDDEDESEDK
jgi:hypothetical protein